ncbi:MAG: hypothetical protein WCO58_01610 [bacterium]
MDNIRHTKDILKQSNQKIVQERKSKRSKWSIAFSVLFVLFVVGVVFFLRWQKFLINNITVEGAVVVEPQMIVDTINKRIGGKYLWLVPKSNTLLISTGRMEHKIQSVIPRISAISVSRVGFKGLHVAIKEYNSQYIWCGSDVAPLGMDSNSQCLFMDKDGFLFGYAPYISGDVYTVLYGTTRKNPGTYGFTKEQFESVSHLLAQIKILGLTVTNVVQQPEDADFSFYIKNNQNQVTEIKVSLTDDSSLIGEHLSSVLASDVFKDRNNVFNMLYIDLRFGNKVFYKAK